MYAPNRPMIQAPLATHERHRGLRIVNRNLLGCVRSITSSPTVNRRNNPATINKAASVVRSGGLPAMPRIELTMIAPAATDFVHV